MPAEGCDYGSFFWVVSGYDVWEDEGMDGRHIYMGGGNELGFEMKLKSLESAAL